MKIRDGCATVTGYKLPQATVRRGREGGSEVQAPSQDIGLTALVVVVVAAVCDRRRKDQLLRQEKDEASLLICFQQNSLDAFIPRIAGV